jgi:hypothetical protein
MGDFSDKLKGELSGIVKEDREHLDKITKRIDREMIAAPIDASIHMYSAAGAFAQYGKDRFITRKWLWQGPEHPVIREIKEKFGIEIRQSNFKKNDGTVIGVEILNYLLCTPLNILVFRERKAKGKVMKMVNREVIAKNWIGTGRRNDEEEYY